MEALLLNPITEALLPTRSSRLLGAVGAAEWMMNLARLQVNCNVYND